MSRRQEQSDSSGIMTRKPGVGVTQVQFPGIPNDGDAGYGPSCIWQNLSGTAGTLIYINQGTNTSATWNAIA